MISSRRHVLTGSAAVVAGMLAVPAGAQQLVRGVFANGDRPLVAFPQKRPLMVLTPRPPQLETPFSIFDEGVFTPNDAFFVRWHNSDIATDIDAATHRIAVRGAVDRVLSLSLADLRKMETVEIAAVNQCSGNSRGFFDPRVAGGQWQNGAMGNAVWKGVRLKAILDRAGLKATAKHVQFQGLDKAIFAATPRFRKALDVDVARGNDVLVAYEMNGKPMPVLNGFPVRIVVPGWYSTYWVKALNAIEVLEREDDQFWMKTAYRIPATPNANVSPTDKGYATVPINRMNVRSFVTNVQSGASLRAGRVPVRGIAFDGGSGIKTVELSIDGGTAWSTALLERDYGNYSFRRWSTEVVLDPGKTYALACRATANDGATQVATPIWNPSGYMRNAIETYKVVTA